MFFSQMGRVGGGNSCLLLISSAFWLTCPRGPRIGRAVTKQESISRPWRASSVRAGTRGAFAAGFLFKSVPWLLAHRALDSGRGGHTLLASGVDCPIRALD